LPHQLMPFLFTRLRFGVPSIAPPPNCPGTAWIIARLFRFLAPLSRGFSPIVQRNWRAEARQFNVWK
ncbi:MAG TPA: hypothetical protein PKI20_13450, partial [Verrucomicrobiota bacterium]|nr:hypothetical protein [Verrucomicrobiota bacterium]